METYKIIKKQELTTAQWSGGTTTQLALFPADADYAKRNFTWRVSSATVEVEESEFTALPGVLRCLMILDGTLHLKHEGHYETTLEKFGQDNFLGEWKTVSRGRVTDFNLMTTSGEGRVQVLELKPAAVTEVSLLPVVQEWASVSELFYFRSDEVVVTLPDSSRSTMCCGDVLVTHNTKSDMQMQIEMLNASGVKAEVIRAVIYHD